MTAYVHAWMLIISSYIYVYIYRENVFMPSPDLEGAAAGLHHVQHLSIY